MTLSRRQVLKIAAIAPASLAIPNLYDRRAFAAPSETVLHVSVGAGGMAGSDIRSLTRSKHIKLVAVADVDDEQAGWIAKAFPECKIYRDWRKMFDQEKFDSVNVSTPDHMHAAPTMRALLAGKHVYTQKPLTQTIAEARRLKEVALEKKAITQMGIQIHSRTEHKTVVALIRAGVIGKVKEVHSWSGKGWGDNNPRPMKKDPVPANFAWDLWLGVADERPFIGNNHYHPGNWRKRLDFGTGTFGDMGCHILDPVFSSLQLGPVLAVQSLSEAPNEHNWALNTKVDFTLTGSPFTAKTVKLSWYNGDDRPGKTVADLVSPHQLAGQGSVYLGEKGVLYSPYIGMPKLLPTEKFLDFKLPEIASDDHYLQFVDAVRGIGATSTPFSYAGPLTEMVLLGCLSTRFPKEKLLWDSKTLSFTNSRHASTFVSRKYRKGWEEKGL